MNHHIQASCNTHTPFSAGLYQKGISFAAIAAIVGTLSFFTMIGIRVVPAYLDYFAITKIINKKLNDTKTGLASSRDLVNSIQTQMDINNIRNMAAKDIIKVRKNRGVLQVKLDYQVSSDFYKNEFSDVAIVMHFHKEFEKNLSQN